MPSTTSFSASAACHLSLQGSLAAVPSLNFFRLTTISIGATVTSLSAAFNVGAAFEIATGASSCASHEEVGCLTATVSASVGVVATPPSLTLGIATSVRGAWLEPLGLYNFALADAGLSLGIQIFTGPVPPVPREFSWQTTMLYKPSGAWPTTLAAYRSPPASLRAFEAALLYESVPHADPLLMSIGFPRFGFKIVLTQLSVGDMLDMAHDVVRSIFRSYDNATVAAPIREPAGPPQLAPSASVFLSLSFSLDLELSLVQDATFRRGVFFSFSASGANLGGFSFDFDCHFSLALPHPSATDMSDFLADPLEAVSGLGIGLGGAVVLPYGIGHAAVDGVLSSTLFALNASAVFHVAGLEFNLSAALHLGADDASLSLYSSAHLPVVGSVELDGHASTSSGFYLHAAFDTHLLIVAMQGALTISVPSTDTLASASVSASGSATFCLLGTLSFAGSLSSTSASLQASIDATVFGSSLRLGGSVSISESNGSPLQLTIGAHATLPQPIGQRTWSFTMGSRRRLAWNAPLATHNATLATEAWAAEASNPPPLATSASFAATAPATDPCSLDSTASIDLLGIVTADLTVSISQASGFAIHADASILGLTSRFNGVINDGGFSVSASQSLTVSLQHHATIDCCQNGCCVSDATPWYEAAAENALCMVGGEILSGCYWELFRADNGWAPRCQNLACSGAAIVFRDLENLIAGSLDIGSFTAGYTVTLSATNGVAAVTVEAHVSYTPSSHASSLFSLSQSTYTFASMTGSLDSSGEIRLRFRLPSDLGSVAEHLGLISDVTGEVCMSASHVSQVADCSASSRRSLHAEAPPLQQARLLESCARGFCPQRATLRAGYS